MHTYVVYCNIKMDNKLYVWIPLKRGDSIPENAVYAGITGADGKVYVAKMDNSPGKVNLKDGFCLIKKDQIQLHNVHISPHNHAGKFFNHEPLRIKRLLAHRKEIEKLKISLERKGLTIIPLSLYLKGSWIKLKIGVGKGRKIHDKRDREKINDSKRDVANALKRF